MRWVLGGLWLLAAGAFVAYQLRPFRFHIGADGLDLRVAGLNRLVPWAEIETVILGQPLPSGGRKRKPASLLLVPAVASTIDRPLTGRSPIDDRPALVLVSLDHIQQPADEVAAALTRFGGSRFTDVRPQPPESSAALPDPELLSRLADLTSRFHKAVESGEASQRLAVKAEVDAALARLPEVPAGSDQPRLDELLKSMSEILGEEDEGAKPA
ncbi:hypothetical protein [Micromonospora sp. NPDC051296]|uniref:hypothetical protein n=1 Tax=Micromonospora sp. NPDC051296 TaxID=3155046 RepID=UPI003424A006